MKSAELKILMSTVCLVLTSCKTVEIITPPVEKTEKIVEEKIKLDKIKPPKLNKGDTIGLIAPGSYISDNQLRTSIKNIEELGYKVKYNDEILGKHGYLAGSDIDRTNDIHSMFLDKNVKAIVAVRGGYGCSRLLPLLNYDIIRNNPKVLIGYSDITSLLFGIFVKTGLISFHGPVGTSTFNEYSVNHMENILTKTDSNYTMKNPVDDNDQIHVIKSGVGEGELVGGNLSIVVSMIGTQYDVDTKDKIIFLEDIGEEPYRIDRMLTQMKQSGKFDSCSAIMLGVFRRCDVDPHNPEFENSLTLRQVLEDRLGDLGVPVIYGLSFGHITNKFTLPFGIRARLDTYNKKLTLLESSVN